MRMETARLISTVFAIAIVALVWNYTIQNKPSNLALVNESLDASEESKESETRVFPSVPLEAEAAIVYDFDRGMSLYELNPDSQLPLASITKLMTVYTALENVPEEFEITIDSDALATEGEFGFTQNSTWLLSELAEYSLVNSANDGTQAIANSVGEFLNTDFVALMTKTGRELGLSQTYFINPTGLDESSTLPSGYGSARDVAKLAATAYRDYKKTFSATTYGEYIAFDKTAKAYKATNTNQDSLGISGLRLSKTGYTDIAGGNLVVVMEIEPERLISIVVLGSSKAGRFDDVNKLAEATALYMSQ